MILCDAAVDRIEDDADKHECEADVSDVGHHIAALDRKCDEGYSKDR